MTEIPPGFDGPRRLSALPAPGAPPPPAPAAKGAAAAALGRDAGLDPKLVEAAHQFEASLMAELLKPLSSGDLFGGGEDAGGAAGGLGSSADGSAGALAGFAAEALAKALSDKGGLGIARRILDHFEAAGSEAAAGEKGGGGGEIIGRDARGDEPKKIRRTLLK